MKVVNSSNYCSCQKDGAAEIKLYVDPVSLSINHVNVAQTWEYIYD